MNNTTVDTTASASFGLRTHNAIMGLLSAFAQKAFRGYHYLSFILNRVGREYGVGIREKYQLTVKIRKNLRHEPGGTSFAQHLLLAEELLKMPKSVKGEVVECGSWRGTSAATLSLVCALVGRKLYVCDSFQGLPEPRNEQERYEIHAYTREEYYVWEKGEYSADLQTVKNTISRYGNISICEFVKGYFEDSLKNLNIDSIAFVFEDADLASSVEDCLRYLWPKMPEGGRFYSHEPWSEHVVALFYDGGWWKRNFNTHIPGFYGSGRGIIAGADHSGVGYAEKYDVEKLKQMGRKRITEGSIQRTEQ